MYKPKCLCAALLLVSVFLTSAQAGTVAIFTGSVNWITKAQADAQATICAARLDSLGIPWLVFSLADDELALADWMENEATNNGEVDVLIIYGYFPSAIYEAGNGQQDGSIAERFIESTDGNAIINHADWMFYVSSSENGAAGLENMMDITGITMGGGNDDTPMIVTDEGRAIAPNLTDFLSDRPLQLGGLAGEWVVEAALAQSADGTLADPVILRDGDRGRLIPMFQAFEQNDPKGAVSAEVIAWLMGLEFVPTKIGLSGPAATVTGSPVKLTISLQDATGTPTPGESDLTVDLASDSGGGAFDTAWTGVFDGTVTSVTIPAGELTTTIYYKDTLEGLTTLSATAAGGLEAQLQVNVLEDLSGERGGVAIYTGNVGWIAQGAADIQAQVCVNKLGALDVDPAIPVEWYPDAGNAGDLAVWVANATNNGVVDVLVLYGYLPTDLYGAGNTQTEGSIAESFIESPDGDLIINHADYMFFVSSQNNDVSGLQNIMDIPGITMWGDNTPMVVTDAGKAIAPSLADFLSDRPFHADELADEWFVEAPLAENNTGTLVDPCLVRDGNRGRLANVYQTNGQDDPKGAVAAEIIAWLYGIERGGPEQVGLSGKTADFAGEPLPITVQIQDGTGSPALVAAATVVNLQTDSGTGAFDMAPDGSFNGTINSVTVAAGESSAEIYYKDTAAGTSLLTGSVAGLEDGTLVVNYFERSFADPGTVAIFTGEARWFGKVLADEQAQICVNRLEDAGITTFWYQNPGPDEELGLQEWMDSATNNGQLDVLVLYGYFPTSIYEAGNGQQDGSFAELFIESTDGDTIINHADYMFYQSNPINDVDGLQNMMDIPGITMWGDNNPMVVTEDGRAIAPSLNDFLSDRPLHLDQLAGNWLVEAALAQSADGLLADPVIVRDGDRGRLIPVFQAADQNDPKGAVAAEIIAWLMQTALVPTQIGLAGPTTTVTETPVKLTITLQDSGGTLVPLAEDVTVELASDSGTGAFDTVWDGSYDGTVTSVTISAGEVTAMVYYKDSSEGLAILSAAAPAVPDLTAGELQLNVLEDASGEPGAVAIYTINTWWINKVDADAQAQICVDRLNALGISNRWFSDPAEEDEFTDWVSTAAEDGKLDVLILYGHFPTGIYPSGNTMTDGSTAELFIESSDGNAIINNHADWMFYHASINGVGPDNTGAGLENMMDIVGITMGGGNDDTQMIVTDEGQAIAPSLSDFLSDRPLQIGGLAGEWFVEAPLAQNDDGTLMDPVILRDGNRGRVIPALQANQQDDPKGDVAADIIAWLFGSEPIEICDNDIDDDGDGDIDCDDEDCVDELICQPEGVAYIRGDANADGSANISDASYILNFLFLGGPDLACLIAGDANQDNATNISDASYILNFLFLGGPDIAAPNACGEEPLAAEEDCLASPACE